MNERNKDILAYELCELAEAELEAAVECMEFQKNDEDLRDFHFALGKGYFAALEEIADRLISEDGYTHAHSVIYNSKKSMIDYYENLKRKDN